MCRGQSKDGSLLSLWGWSSGYKSATCAQQEPRASSPAWDGPAGLLLVFGVRVNASLPFILYNLPTRQSSSHRSVMEAAIPSQEINPGEWMPTPNVSIWFCGNAPFKPRLRIKVHFRWVCLAVSFLLLWSRIQSRNLLFPGQPSQAGVSD